MDEAGNHRAVNRFSRCCTVWKITVATFFTLALVDLAVITTCFVGVHKTLIDNNKYLCVGMVDDVTGRQTLYHCAEKSHCYPNDRAEFFSTEYILTVMICNPYHVSFGLLAALTSISILLNICFLTARCAKSAVKYWTKSNKFQKTTGDTKLLLTEVATAQAMEDVDWYWAMGLRGAIMIFTTEMVLQYRLLEALFDARIGKRMYCRFMAIMTGVLVSYFSKVRVDAVIKRVFPYEYREISGKLCQIDEISVDITETWKMNCVDPKLCNRGMALLFQNFGEWNICYHNALWWAGTSLHYLWLFCLLLLFLHIVDRSDIIYRAIWGAVAERVRRYRSQNQRQD
ncbi:unnamed protein product, partial [Mesorhabditis spiculigera]